VVRSWFVGCVSFCWLLFSPLSLSQNSIDLEPVKKQGLFLYHLGRHQEAFPLLKPSAEKGDQESQYCLGDMLREKNFGYLTREAIQWFEHAALQGHLYAMVALTSEHTADCFIYRDCSFAKRWKAKALEAIEQKANDGNGEAMLLTYYVTNDLNWLSRSAESGFSDAMYRLGREYGKGEGIFLTPNRRQLAADEWIVKAAEGGHLIAINDVVEMKSFQNDLKGVRYWTERGLEGGGFNATARYARWLSDAPTATADSNDLIKAYGLTVLLDEAAPTRWSGRTYRALEEIAAMMTPSQIKAGQLFAEEWVRKHPPLRKDSR